MEAPRDSSVLARVLGEQMHGESRASLSWRTMMKVYLEPWEVERMEEQATNLRDRLLIRLLSHLGCRISEALALTVQDIDLEQGRVTIEHLKARLKLSCPHCNARLGKSHAFCPRCGARVEQAVMQQREHRRVRTLPIDGDTLEMLRDYIRRGGPISQKGRMLIFGINRHRAWQIVSGCAEKAGLPSLANPETGRVHNVSPHRLRDAFAIMAVQRDDSTDSIRMLQEQLGHASIGTTMRYRKVAGEELKDWYMRLWGQRDNG
jgi:integrase/recombinase XerD